MAVLVASAAAGLAHPRARLALPLGGDRYPGAARPCARDYRGQVGNELDAAASALAPRQRRRIARAAEAFLLSRPDLARLEPRFDLMLVAPLRVPQHWPGAWRAD